MNIIMLIALYAAPVTITTTMSTNNNDYYNYVAMVVGIMWEAKRVNEGIFKMLTFSGNLMLIVY